MTDLADGEIGPLASRPLATDPGIREGNRWIVDTTGAEYVVDTVGGVQVWLPVGQGLTGPLTRTLFVDAGSTASVADGSLARPYATITAALAVIPAATTA